VTAPAIYGDPLALATDYVVNPDLAGPCEHCDDAPGVAVVHGTAPVDRMACRRCLEIALGDESPAWLELTTTY
jgi:hypothetical protein